MLKIDEGTCEVRGDMATVLAELSTLCYSLRADAKIPSFLIRDAVKDGLDLAEAERKLDGADILEKYLAELSSRVLGDPS